MGWIAWDDTLVLGQAEMDADHRQLLDLLNQLADGVVHPGKRGYGALLDELFAHAKRHFDMEQRLMAAHRYPYAEEHSAEHASLIRSALEYRARFDADAQPSLSLLYFFEQWLTRHILNSDKELARFLAAGNS